MINTHVHGDHSGGNAFFQKLAPVIAHDNVRARLMTGAEKSVTPEGWPIITFSDEVTLHLNGEEIRILHVPPAHTDGAKVLHMGDVFMDAGISFGERTSGGSYAGLSQTLDQVLPKIPADAKIVPGHGPIATRADVERGIRAGKSMQQLVAEKPFEKWKGSLPWFISSTDGYVKDFYKELTAMQPGN